jgi:hypothetical protein
MGWGLLSGLIGQKEKEPFNPELINVGTPYENRQEAVEALLAEIKYNRDKMATGKEPSIATLAKLRAHHHLKEFLPAAHAWLHADAAYNALAVYIFHPPPADELESARQNVLGRLKSLEAALRQY